MTCLWNLFLGKNRKTKITAGFFCNYIHTLIRFFPFCKWWYIHMDGKHFQLLVFPQPQNRSSTPNRLSASIDLQCWHTADCHTRSMNLLYSITCRPIPKPSPNILSLSSWTYMASHKFEGFCPEISKLQVSDRLLTWTAKLRVFLFFSRFPPAWWFG